jgi:hypothetical protein
LSKEADSKDHNTTFIFNMGDIPKGYKYFDFYTEFILLKIIKNPKILDLFSPKKRF